MPCARVQTCRGRALADGRTSTAQHSQAPCLYSRRPVESTERLAGSAEVVEPTNATLSTPPPTRLANLNRHRSHYVSQNVHAAKQPIEPQPDLVCLTTTGPRSQVEAVEEVAGRDAPMRTSATASSTRRIDDTGVPTRARERAGRGRRGQRHQSAGATPSHTRPQRSVASSRGLVMSDNYCI